MKKFTFILYSLISLSFLTACGGGSGSSSEKITTAQPTVPTTPIVDAIFTEDNAGDIAIWSTVLTETSIDAADLIEKEMIWFHHAPEQILTRKCNNSGSVEKVIDEAQNNYRLIFTNCSYQTDIIEGENSTTIVNGTVDITQKNIKLNENRSPYSDSFLILDFSADIFSESFIISTIEEPSTVIELKFELSLTSNQVWDVNGEDLNGDTVLNYLSKDREVDIKRIDFNIKIDDFAVVKDTMSQVNISQHINSPNSNKFPHYQIDITSKITSQLFEFKTDLTSSVTGKYSRKGSAPQSPSGTFTFTNDQDEEISLTLITNEYMQLHFNKAPLGEAETIEWQTSALFNLHDNSEALALTQELTPFEVISITKETAEDDPIEKVIIKFNKHVSRANSGSGIDIQISSGLASNPFYQPTVLVTDNSFIINFDTNESDGFFEIYYDGAYKLITSEKSVEQRSGATRGMQIIGGIGEVIPFDHPVIKARYSSIFDHIITFNEEGDIKTIDIETGQFIKSSGDTNIRFESICLSSDQESIFLTGYNYTNEKYQLVEYKHAELSFINSYAHEISSQSVKKCTDEQLIFVDDDSIEQFNFSTLDFTYTETNLSSILNIVPYPSIDNQFLYVLNSNHSGYGLFILTLEPFEIKQVSTPLVDSWYTYNYSGDDEHSIFIDALNETILARNKVINMNDTSEVLHTFTDGERSWPEDNEYIQYHNEKHNIIVTNYAVYDATTFEELIDLPVIPAASNWFVDNNNRLSIILDSSIYRVKLN
jgi:hypothetical protein